MKMKNCYFVFIT